MDLISKPRKAWPYAQNSPKNSVGPWRGTLLLGLRGRVDCWDAMGDARREFTEQLKGKIRLYLEQNNEKVQDSGNIIDFSLFMVGRSALRAKPTIMFVSEDKRARKEAFKMIKDSDIMKEYPGFELAHIPLKAEFENLTILAGEVADSVYDACFLGESPNLYTLQVGKLEGRRLYFYNTSVSEEAPRTATAGGVIAYQGKLMFLTVNHFLERTQTMETQPVVSDPEEDDDDCEITGLSDFDDENDDGLINATSRGSVTPESEASGVDSSESGNHGAPVSSSGSNCDAQKYMAAVQARLERLDQSQESIPYVGTLKDQCIGGKVILRSKELDYALVEVDPALINPDNIGDNIIELGDDSQIETQPRDAAVKTITPDGGIVGGTLSGTPSFVRLPYAKTFTEVYIARFDRPLVPGDCGSWVRDAATGCLFGHVFAGSPTSGLAMVMPSRYVFEDIRCCLVDQLGNSEAKSVDIAEENAEEGHKDQDRQPQPPASQVSLPADVLLEAPLDAHTERDQWQARVMMAKARLDSVVLGRNEADETVPLDHAPGYETVYGRRQLGRQSVHGLPDTSMTDVQKTVTTTNLLKNKRRAMTRRHTPQKLGRSQREREREWSESWEDEWESFPQFCMTCEKQFIPHDDMGLYCSDNCRRIDQTSISQPTASVRGYSSTNYHFYPTGNPEPKDIIPHASPSRTSSIHPSSPSITPGTGSTGYQPTSAISALRSLNIRPPSPPTPKGSTSNLWPFSRSAATSAHDSYSPPSGTYDSSVKERGSLPGRPGQLSSLTRLASPGCQELKTAAS